MRYTYATAKCIADKGIDAEARFGELKPSDIEVWRNGSDENGKPNTDKSKDPIIQRTLKELGQQLGGDFQIVRITPPDDTPGQSISNDPQKNGGKTMTNTIQSLLLANLNVILTGAPGTGKTYTAKEVAKAMVGSVVPEGATEEAKKAAKEAEDERMASVQFHPGYDYSDFVIGMKPVLVSEEGLRVFRDNDGLFTRKEDKDDGERQSFSGKTTVSYHWLDGIFKEFASKARKAYDDADDKGKAPKFVFLIDEINRADLSRVFGELFSLLEEEYRYPNNKKGITLPNGEPLHIPENLYIIGTMNDIDRSVESMDFALRRRFAWKEVTAEESEGIIDQKVSDKGAAEKLKRAMRNLNIEIGGVEKGGVKPSLDLRLGTAYQLGGAIFAKFAKYEGADDPFGKLWSNHIDNILQEYLRGRSDSNASLEALRKKFNEAVGKTNGDKTAEGQSEAGTREA